MNQQNTASMLWLGAGDLASRCDPMLADLKLSRCFVTRSPRLSRSTDAKFLAADLSDVKSALDLAVQRPDICVCSFSPAGRSEQEYDKSYYQSLENIVAGFAEIEHKPKLLLFISSTSVYPQANGEFVSEASDTQSYSVSSTTMLACERLLAEQSFATCALRFSGIYGPGRYHLLRRVSKGLHSGETWTNRIHVDDCAGIISFLIERCLAGGAVPPILLASDDEPVQSEKLSLWLAEQLGVELNVELNNGAKQSGSIRGQGKRCDNRLLHSLGYRFRYPNYRAGFPDIITAFKADSSA